MEVRRESNTPGARGYSSVSTAWTLELGPNRELVAI